MQAGRFICTSTKARGVSSAQEPYLVHWLSTSELVTQADCEDGLVVVHACGSTFGPRIVGVAGAEMSEHRVDVGALGQRVDGTCMP